MLPSNQINAASDYCGLTSDTYLDYTRCIACYYYTGKVIKCQQTYIVHLIHMNALSSHPADPQIGPCDRIEDLLMIPDIVAIPKAEHPLLLILCILTK